VKYPTEAQKAEALRLYNKHRDRLILKYLRYLRRQYKHSADAFERNDRLRKYNSVATAFWKGRVKRDYPFIKPQPSIDHTRNRFNYTFKGPGFVLDTEDPRYGHLPEGYFYLVLDGREYDHAVTFEIDDETQTIFIRPYITTWTTVK